VEQEKRWLLQLQIFKCFSLINSCKSFNYSGLPSLSPLYPIYTCLSQSQSLFCLFFYPLPRLFLVEMLFPFLCEYFWQGGISDIFGWFRSRRCIFDEYKLSIRHLWFLVIEIMGKLKEPNLHPLGFFFQSKTQFKTSIEVKYDLIFRYQKNIVYLKTFLVWYTSTNIYKWWNCWLLN
jgi:hypothetical protein